jgi:hypothetical protein
MTPDKRATLLKVFGWTLAAALVVGGYIGQYALVALWLGAK